MMNVNYEAYLYKLISNIDEQLICSKEELLFSYDRERIGKLIVTSKHQYNDFHFFLHYYQLNGLFSF